jgi:hypothetical protein
MSPIAISDQGKPARRGMDGRHGILYRSRLPAQPPRGEMNISMNIDCSPEEARRLMGLPDMTPIHNLYLEKLREAMTGGMNPDALEQMMQSWAPMGEVGMKAWRQLIEQMTASPKG